MANLSYPVNSTVHSRSVAGPLAERPAVSRSHLKSTAAAPHPQMAVGVVEGTTIVGGELQGNVFGGDGDCIPTESCGECGELHLLSLSRSLPRAQPRSDPRNMNGA